jgi:hypothetical protein
VTEWTLATVLAAAEPIARARGLEIRAYLVNGPGMGAVRIEVLREPSPGSAPRDDSGRMFLGSPLPIDLDTREVSCWLELPCLDLDAVDTAPGGVTELVALEVTRVLRMRHGIGAAA